MIFYTMIKNTSKKQPLTEVCRSLLRKQEESKSRSEIAKELEIDQHYLNKWLDYGQGMSDTKIGRVLEVYGGGMDPDTIAELILLFKDKPEVIKNLIMIERSNDKDAIEKIEEEIGFWSKRTSR